jgi:hypothetical protein
VKVVREAGARRTEQALVDVGSKAGALSKRWRMLEAKVTRGTTTRGTVLPVFVGKNMQTNEPSNTQNMQAHAV